MISFTILGEPTAKQRPRFNRGYAYTPLKTINYENWVKSCYIEVHEDSLAGELSANITAYYSIPKTTTKKKKEMMLANKIRPTKKPDLDNIAKIILDSLNGLAYHDDSQVVELKVSKYYSEEPRVEVDISEVM